MTCTTHVSDGSVITAHLTVASHFVYLSNSERFNLVNISLNADIHHWKYFTLNHMKLTQQITRENFLTFLKLRNYFYFDSFL